MGQASSSVPPSSRRKFLAVGQWAVLRAVERSKASVVVVGTEGVSSMLIQHLPVLCAMHNVTVVMVAATPEALASSIKMRCRRATAVAFLASCAAVPRMAAFCKEVKTNVAAPRLPFLLRSRRELNEAQKTEAEEAEVQAAHAQVPEGVIPLPSAEPSRPAQPKPGARLANLRSSLKDALSGQKRAAEPPVVKVQHEAAEAAAKRCRALATESSSAAAPGKASGPKPVAKAAGGTGDIYAFFEEMS